MQSLLKAVWRFLRKLGLKPPFDPVIPLLGLYTKDLKSAYYSDKVTSMFIVDQLTIAKLWKQSRCPSMDEWIREKWYIYTKCWGLCHADYAKMAPGSQPEVVLITSVVRKSVNTDTLRCFITGRIQVSPHKQHVHMCS